MTTHNTFGWEIAEKPIYANNATLKGYKAIFRNDNQQLLNVAKQSYTPTPNTRFVEVVERLNEITGFPIRCYDEFEGGKKVLAFLECTEPIQVCGYDFQDFMLIGNSHDSSTGFFIGNSSKMIRCANRFSKIFRQLQVRHTKNHDAEIEQLLRYFETYMNQRKGLFQQMERFANVKIDQTLKDALAERLVRMTEEEKAGKAEISTRKQNLLFDIERSIDIECNALGDNLFGLLNGITHYTTHTRKTKEQVFGNALGSLARINQEAFQFCEAYA
ncbi:MAG: DUF932 domain-containing protein [Spirosomataceae bacterium]